MQATTPPPCELPSSALTPLYCKGLHGVEQPQSGEGYLVLAFTYAPTIPLDFIICLGDGAAHSSLTNEETEVQGSFITCPTLHGQPGKTLGKTLGQMKFSKQRVFGGSASEI